MTRILYVAAMLSARLGSAQEPPTIEHEPVPCTVPEKPFVVCARVSDDGQVARTRVYFRPQGDDLFTFVEMSFGGLSYCATLPAPRAKTRHVEYYVQAVDDTYETARTNAYQVRTQPPEACSFAPVEKDSTRQTPIVVYATSPKQKKLPAAYASDGVAFIAQPRR